MPRKLQAMNFANYLYYIKGSEVRDLHQIVTLDAYVNIRQMVVALQDTHVLSKIYNSDLIAKDVKYHLKCLSSLKTDIEFTRGQLFTSQTMYKYT